MYNNREENKETGSICESILTHNMATFINGSEVKGKIKESGTTIINVTASWCGPCQMFAPILEEIGKTVDVFKVDIDTNREFAQEMGVQGVPATFIYKDGKLSEQISGYVPKEVLEQKI